MNHITVRKTQFLANKKAKLENISYEEALESYTDVPEEEINKQFMELNKLDFQFNHAAEYAEDAIRFGLVDDESRSIKSRIADLLREDAKKNGLKLEVDDTFTDSQFLEFAIQSCVEAGIPLQKAIAYSAFLLVSFRKAVERVDPLLKLLEKMKMELPS